MDTANGTQGARDREFRDCAKVGKERESENVREAVVTVGLAVTCLTETILKRLRY